MLTAETSNETDNNATQTSVVREEFNDAFENHEAPKHGLPNNSILNSASYLIHKN